MPPGTIHFVFGVAHTLTSGRNFFCGTTIATTLKTRVFEHCHGLASTNAEYIHAELILGRMTMYCWLCLIHRQMDAPYPPDSVAALILMSLRPQCFEAQLVAPSDVHNNTGKKVLNEAIKYRQQQRGHQFYQQRNAARGCAFDILEWMKQRAEQGQPFACSLKYHFDALSAWVVSKLEEADLLDGASHLDLSDDD